MFLMFLKVITENGPTLVNIQHIDTVSAHPTHPLRTVLGLAGTDSHLTVYEPLAEVERRILYGVVPQPVPEYERTEDG